MFRKGAGSTEYYGRPATPCLPKSRTPGREGKSNMVPRWCRIIRRYLGKASHIARGADGANSRDTSTGTKARGERPSLGLPTQGYLPYR